MGKYMYALLCDVMIDIIRGKKNIDEIGTIFDPEFSEGLEIGTHDNIFDIYCKGWGEFQYDAYNDEFSKEYPTKDAFITKCREIIDRLIKENKVKTVPFGNNVGRGVDIARTTFDKGDFVRFILEKQIKNGIHCSWSRRDDLLNSVEYLRYFQQYFPESAEILEKLSNCFEIYHERYEDGISFEDILEEKGFYSEYDKFLRSSEQQNVENIPGNVKQALAKFSEVYIDGYDEPSRAYANAQRRRHLNLKDFQSEVGKFIPDKARELIDTSANNRYMLTGNNLFGLEKRCTIRINEAGRMQLCYLLKVNSGLMQLDRTDYLYGMHEDNIVLEETATKETFETADQNILKAAQKFFCMTNEQVFEQYNVRMGRCSAIPMIPNAVVMDVVMEYLQKNGTYDSISHTWVDNGLIRIKQKDGSEIVISANSTNRDFTKQTCVVRFPDGSEVKFDSIVKEDGIQEPEFIGIDDLYVDNIEAKGAHKLIPDIVKKLEERFGIRINSIPKDGCTVNISDVKSLLEANALTLTTDSVTNVLQQADESYDKRGVTKDE